MRLFHSSVLAWPPFPLTGSVANTSMDVCGFPGPPPPTHTLSLFDNSSGSAGMSAAQRDTHNNVHVPHYCYCLKGHWVHAVLCLSQGLFSLCRVFFFVCKTSIINTLGFTFPVPVNTRRDVHIRQCGLENPTTI